jgi:hypothetical protein
LTFLQSTFPETGQITSTSGNYHPILGLKSRYFPLKISKPGIAAYTVTVTTSPMLLGADDNSRSTEKRSESKGFTLRLVQAGGGATRLLTLT